MMQMLEARLQRELRDFILDISITAREGEITILKGENGSGKTTILRLISGLMEPDAGYIRIRDREILDTKREICVPVQNRKIGYILQDSMVFPHMTVMGNVVYGLQGSGLSVSDMKNKAELWLSLLRITSFAGIKAKNLSGGQKQRVALARALVTRPDLLLMDEPFSGLDQETREIVRICVQKYVRERKIPCILVSHHDTEITGLADRILEISNGKMIEEG